MFFEVITNFICEIFSILKDVFIEKKIFRKTVTSINFCLEFEEQSYQR